MKPVSVQIRGPVVPAGDTVSGTGCCSSPSQGPSALQQDTVDVAYSPCTASQPGSSRSLRNVFQPLTRLGWVDKHLAAAHLPRFASARITSPDDTFVAELDLAVK